MQIPDVLPTSLPFLSSINFGVLINKPVMLGILGVFFVLYCVLSAVLVYHWAAYGMRSRGIIVAESLYFLVSIVLFVSAGLSIFYY